MRKLFFNLTVVLALTAFLAPVISYAQQPNQQEETVTVPKRLLSDQQLKQAELEVLKEKVKVYGSWVGLGKEVGEAVDSALGALTKRSEEFSQTGVGKFTMVLVGWKVIGSDLVQLIVGVLLFLMGIPIWIWSYYKNCVTRSVLTEVLPDKTKKYQVINVAVKSSKEFCDPVRFERSMHWVALMIFIVIDLIVFFA